MQVRKIQMEISSNAEKDVYQSVSIQKSVSVEIVLVRKFSLQDQSYLRNMVNLKHCNSSSLRMLSNIILFILLRKL